MAGGQCYGNVLQSCLYGHQNVKKLSSSYIYTHAYNGRERTEREQ